MYAVGESRDDVTDEENIMRPRLLGHGLLLVAFSSSEVTRKRGRGLSNHMEFGYRINSITYDYFVSFDPLHSYHV
ncbi:hypothetical protein BHE74_00022452 [Ensete ventricosum]|nr:hypothetical protein GW17_00026042 [Ensete ventricosum]RWW69906.1 hypothetical protein BHE74_00022452 [Ensete ventricosum]RZS10841.1 hypothetical protein BHM03_00042110 [Ensete ventricosum]